jgi:hypothetical protein
MSTSCTVIIGAAELLDALREIIASDGEVLSFSDRDALKALDEMTTRRPAVIGLERLFAATSRGAALINRIKADPALAHAEIRVLSVDGSYRVSPRRAARRRKPSATAAPHPTIALSDDAIEPIARAADEPPAPAHNLDYRGTRRAQRVRMVDGTEMQLDGALATIVDLSTYGAQILYRNPLKPQQKVRMVLADDLGNVKFSATVVWASFEIPKGAARYRAGVEFTDAEPTAVAAFCKRHRLPPV